MKAVRLAEVTGAEIVPGYVVRLDNARFELRLGPSIEVEAGKDVQTLQRNVRALNAVIEPIVLEHLDQWFMLHELRDLYGA